MDRRRFIASALAIPAVLSKSRSAKGADEPAFNSGTVRALARDLASKPYRGPDYALPSSLEKIGYDDYRGIRFKPERALWRNERLPFELQFFHRGFLYANRVKIYQVAQGKVEPFRYAPDQFSFAQTAAPAPDSDLDFAGFRIHTPLNRADYYDEVGAFLGASYFRAVAKAQNYGISARGLAIKTADGRGEEFPYFKAFWIEKPNARATSIVVHALLDSVSGSAAYRFTIRPGVTTVYDVEMALYPRADIDQAGIAPLTSMFFFASSDRRNVDDFRPAVHDSDGLAIRNGRGENIWRPLSNPRDLQVSIFSDANPRGFGLLQRQRNFAGYDDLESHFESRPSLWVEPIGDWGEGAVHLVEIPTKQEYHDNIAAFWRPKDTLRTKGEYTLTYRLHWGVGIPDPAPLALIQRTSIGGAPDDGRLFVVEFVGERLKGVTADALRGMVDADRGEIKHVVMQPNPATGGWRLSFQLIPKEAVVELRARLLQADDVVSETWLYRWTN